MLLASGRGSRDTRLPTLTGARAAVVSAASDESPVADGDGRVFRVNPPHTYATRRLVYVPLWVNDGSWLWKPDLDGNRLLYTRWDSSAGSGVFATTRPLR